MHFLLSLTLHPALNFPLGIALGDGFTLVVVFLTFAEADLQLGPAVLVDVHPKGDQGHAVEGQRLVQLADLLLVEEQPAGPAP